MHTKLLTAAVGAALAVSPMLASAEATLYGRINTSYEKQKVEGTAASGWAFKSNSSRFGFRAKEGVGGSLAVVAGAEFEFNSDNRTGGITDNRNAYIGLVGEFGTVSWGVLDSGAASGSPLYTPILASMSYVNNDSGTGGLSTLMRAENRTQNAIGYRSPKFGPGLYGMFRYAQQGTEDATTGASEAVLEESLKHYSGSMNYDSGPLKASIGFASRSQEPNLAANAFKSKVQAVASYDFKVIKVAGFIGNDEFESPTAGRRDDTTTYVVGVRVPVQKVEFIANYLNGEVQANDQAKTWVQQVGVGYNFSRTARAYAFYDRRDPSDKAANDKVTSIAAGMRLNF
jgi:predicted porin